MASELVGKRNGQNRHPFCWWHLIIPRHHIRSEQTALSEPDFDCVCICLFVLLYLQYVLRLRRNSRSISKSCKISASAVKIMGPIKSKVSLVLWANAVTLEKRHGHKLLARLYLPQYKQGDKSQSRWVQWSYHHVKYTKERHSREKARGGNGKHCITFSLSSDLGNEFIISASYPLQFPAIYFEKY